MKTALLLLLLSAVSALADSWGTTRIEVIDKGPEVVVVCSGERFPLSVEKDAAIATGRDEYQRWVSSPFRDVLNQTFRNDNGKDVLRCTPGGAVIWTEANELDFHAACLPRCDPKRAAAKAAAPVRKNRTPKETPR